MVLYNLPEIAGQRWWLGQGAMGSGGHCPQTNGSIVGPLNLFCRPLRNHLQEEAYLLYTGCI